MTSRGQMQRSRTMKGVALIVVSVTWLVLLLPTYKLRFIAIPFCLFLIGVGRVFWLQNPRASLELTCGSIGFMLISQVIPVEFSALAILAGSLALAAFAFHHSNKRLS